MVINIIHLGDITKINGAEIELSYDDLLISSESALGYVSASEGGMTVVLDVHLTPDLIDEGIEREMVSRIQTMRKEAGFEVVDRITVNFITADAGVKNALINGKDLKGVVLADAIVEGDADGFKKELDINGANCVVILNKVNK